jgi:hypothetical protein
MNLNPELLVETSEKINACTLDFLTKRQIVDRLERGKQVILSKIMCRVKLANPAMSSEMVKAHGFADPEYGTFLVTLDQAERELLLVQNQMQTLQNYFNALQSYFSYRREEMRRISG